MWKPEVLFVPQLWDLCLPCPEFHHRGLGGSCAPLDHKTLSHLASCVTKTQKVTPSPSPVVWKSGIWWHFQSRFGQAGPGVLLKVSQGSWGAPSWAVQPCPSPSATGEPGLCEMEKVPPWGRDPTLDYGTLIPFIPLLLCPS